jgi:hypothetical protein
VNADGDLEDLDRDLAHQRMRIVRRNEGPPSEPPREPVEGPSDRPDQWMPLPRASSFEELVERREAWRARRATVEWQWWGMWWWWSGSRWERWSWYGEAWIPWDDKPALYEPDAIQLAFNPPTVIAVASLSAFLGAFAASFSKEAGQAAGAAAARMAGAAARHLGEHLLRRRHDSIRSDFAAIEVHDDRQILLLTGDEVDRLPDEAYQQLIDLDFPKRPGRIRWDPYQRRWIILNTLNRGSATGPPPDTSVS